MSKEYKLLEEKHCSNMQQGGQISKEEINLNNSGQDFCKKKNLLKRNQQRKLEQTDWSLPDLNKTNKSLRQNLKLGKKSSESLYPIGINKNVGLNFTLGDIDEKVNADLARVTHFNKHNDNPKINFDEDKFFFDDYEISSDEEDRKFDGHYYSKAEDISVNEYVNQMNNFYEEMSAKLKLLKSCSVLNRTELSDAKNKDKIKNDSNNNSYKNLKDTPQVQQNLNLIQKLEKNIKETIDQYETERDERLQIQQTLINQIPLDKDNEIFMQLCNFESKSNTKINNSQGSHGNYGKLSSNRTRKNENFIERNIKLAKKGAMTYSLTDEEKQRVETILQEIDAKSSEKKLNIDQRVEEVYSNLSTELKRTTNDLNSYLDKNSEIYQACNVNAFRLSDEEKDKLIEIDSALKQYENERTDECKNEIKDNDFVQSLKDVDEKLAALKSTYREEEEKLDKLRKKTSD